MHRSMKFFRFEGLRFEGCLSGAHYGTDRSLLAGSKVLASEGAAGRHYQGTSRQYPLADRGKTGGAAEEAWQPHASGQPVRQAAARDWSDYVSHLLESFESGAGSCVSGAGRRQYRDGCSRQTLYSESQSAAALSQCRSQCVRLGDSGLRCYGFLWRQDPGERSMGSTQVAATGEERSPQVSFRVDRTARDSNHLWRVVAGRVALPISYLRPGYCFAQVRSRVALDLSGVCGNSAG